MVILKRCDACEHIIWPWQPFGFVVHYDGTRVRWHLGCGKPWWVR